MTQRGMELATYGVCLTDRVRNEVKRQKTKVTNIIRKTSKPNGNGPLCLLEDL